MDKRIIDAQAKHLDQVFDLARGKLDNHDCHLSGEDGCDCSNRHDPDEPTLEERAGEEDLRDPYDEYKAQEIRELNSK